VALWEKLVEDRDESAAAVQKLREAVKSRFPAPGASDEEEAAEEAAEDEAEDSSEDSSDDSEGGGD